jgi:hypothetical protein
VFDWIKPTWEISQEKIRKTRGFDAYMYNLGFPYALSLPALCSFSSGHPLHTLHPLSTFCHSVSHSPFNVSQPLPTSTLCPLLHHSVSHSRSPSPTLRPPPPSALCPLPTPPQLYFPLSIPLLPALLLVHAFSPSSSHSSLPLTWSQGTWRSSSYVAYPAF